MIFTKFDQWLKLLGSITCWVHFGARRKSSYLISPTSIVFFIENTGKSLENSFSLPECVTSPPGIFLLLKFVFLRFYSPLYSLSCECRNLPEVHDVSISSS